MPLPTRSDYEAFLRAKVPTAPVQGTPIPAADLHPSLKPHQRDVTAWMVQGGRRAVFAKFGLGKTRIQLEACRATLARHPGARGLIVCPLGVRGEFLSEAAALGIALTFIRDGADATAPGLYLTNYETAREGKIDPALFVVVSLDEAAILRGFGGVKTFREFMRLFADVPYRFVATAVPSPNEYIELLAYAAFLGIMDVGEGKTRWFKRNPEKADELTLHPHKVEEFWAWVHSWAVFLQRPSDLGYDDTGYDLPPLRVDWHPIPVSPDPDSADAYGQRTMLREVSLGVVSAARERRATLDARVAKVLELALARGDDQVIVWCDLNDEQQAITRGLEAAGVRVASLTGAQAVEEREALLAAWKRKACDALVTKPVMYGAGVNLQQCHTVIYAGVGFKFSDWIQALHRVHRYGQTAPVHVHVVHAESEQPIVRALQAKWRRHEEQVARMAAIIREHGLDALHSLTAMTRAMGVERKEAVGDHWRLINGDAVLEVADMAPDSITGMILTSIPFGTQYEYSPSYHDFGHTDDDEHFWQQMGFLSPALLRALAPGRIMAVHVKDRVRPGGMDGYGFQTVSPFHADAILHYRAHGFAYLGMITIATDVVRENNQTYRLGWSEQCKDGSRMSVGMPEYVLLFRKPPTDRSDGYADVRVVKDKATYTRARWQIDAHAVWRSSGNRVLLPDELLGLPADVIFSRFRAFSWARVYDYAHHVAIGEALEARKSLPPGFMLLPPQSSHPDVWADVVRMRTLNTLQAASGREQHLCPLPLDIVDRLIHRYTNPGEVVFDPFAGLGTVPMRAVALDRRGLGTELATGYWREAVRYVRAEDERRAVPTLFDLVPADEPAEVA